MGSKCYAWLFLVIFVKFVKYAQIISRTLVEVSIKIQQARLISRDIP